MANKEDLVKKLTELLKRSDELNKDLKDLSNLIFYSDLIRDPDKEEKIIKTPESEIIPPPVIQQAITPVTPPVKREEPVITPIIPPVKKEEVLPIAEQSKRKSMQDEVIPPVLVKPMKRSDVPPKYREPKKSFFEKNPDLEKFIGERLITFIGIAVLVTGIAFFVKYAIDRDWITETGRTFIGILCGGVLLGFAHRLRKAFTTFSSILVGGGIAVLYFSITYSFQIYHLYSQPIAFMLLIGITAFTVLLSISYDRRELAVLAIVGGFGSPLMIANGGGNFPVLCTYMLVLNTGMLTLAYFRKWNVVNVVSYFFTILLFAGAVIQEMGKKEPAYIIALIFSTSYYCIFFCMNVINNIRKKTAFGVMEIIVLLSNSFLFYSVGYFILSRVHEGLFLGLFTVGVGVFNFIFAFLLYRRQEVDRNLIYFLIGLVLTFVSLAGPVQLHGSYITLFWAAEGVLLLWLFQRTKIQLIFYASLLVNFLTLMSLFIDWIKKYGYGYGESGRLIPDFFINKGFVTSVFVLLSFLGTILLIRKDRENPVFGKDLYAETYKRILSIVFIVVLYLGFLLEISFQFDTHSHSAYGLPVVVGLYNSVFVISLLLASNTAALKFLRITAVMLGLFQLVLFFGFPQGAVIHTRNLWLIDHSLDEKFPFLLHFANTVLVICLVFLVRKMLFAFSELDKHLKTAYLWLMCVVLVFAGSAELDHFFILSTYNAMQPDITHALELSRRIGYPIFWGLFSFGIILVGMRQQSRQLRIISLTLFFITVIKLISLGIYGESEAGKIIAFILSGVILLVVAFMYQKLKKLFVEDVKPENTDHETKIA